VKAIKYALIIDNRNKENVGGKGARAADPKCRGNCILLVDYLYTVNITLGL